MYRWLFIVSLLIIHFTINAQQLPLLMQLDEQKKPFLLHTVAPKENFYSIGRIYNISPRVYAPYNGLTIDSGLSIGRQIRIPLTETNFWRTGARKANETIVPVYHTVLAKETLFGISQLYKVDRSALTSWNNLSADQLVVGSQLIVGYLKVDKNLSPLATQGIPTRSEPNFRPDRTVIPRDTIKQAQEVVANQKAKTDTPAAPIKTPPAVVKEEAVAPPKQVPVVEKQPEPSDAVTYKGSGFFKDEYNQQSKQGKNAQSKSVKGGSFKSTSGWSDGKFYILIDSIEKGTIVKLINRVTQEFVFAKVLASVAETKPDAKEEFLISNAAAAQLNVTGFLYDLEISWEK